MIGITKILKPVISNRTMNTTKNESINRRTEGKSGQNAMIMEMSCGSISYFRVIVVSFSSYHRSVFFRFCVCFSWKAKVDKRKEKRFKNRVEQRGKCWLDTVKLKRRQMVSNLLLI